MTYKTFAFYQISVGAHKQIFLLVNSHLLIVAVRPASELFRYAVAPR